MLLLMGGAITSPSRLDQVAQPPVLISQIKPDYPYLARLQGIKGQGLLEAMVDREGRLLGEKE